MANKKTISPVVATALLLVVAVVAVVGFQTWFKDYQSGIQADAEQKSQMSANVDILKMTNETIYVKNGGAEAVFVDVLVEGATCSDIVNKEISASQMTNIDISSDCSGITKGKKYTITLMSDGLDAPVEKTFLYN